MDKESAAALGGKGIDWALASKQHAGYVDALSKIVDSVEVMSSRRANDDSCLLPLVRAPRFTLRAYQLLHLYACVGWRCWLKARFPCFIYTLNGRFCLFDCVVFVAADSSCV